jgi:hypothetical protein
MVREERRSKQEGGIRINNSVPVPLLDKRLWCAMAGRSRGAEGREET